MPPVTGSTLTFNKANVDASPAKPGVYELLVNGNTIYYGMSASSIRARLQSHQAGNDGACTKAATSFRVEVTTAASAATRERQLLAEYQRTHSGRLPRCNERAA
jgi:hypothetical protein